MLIFFLNMLDIDLIMCNFRVCTLYLIFFRKYISRRYCFPKSLVFKKYLHEGTPIICAQHIHFKVSKWNNLTNINQLGKIYIRYYEGHFLE